MVAFFIVGWFLEPSCAVPLREQSRDGGFVRLQQGAAEYLEDHMADQRIATAWPFSEAVINPEFGYVRRPLNLTVRTAGSVWPIWRS